MVPLNPVFFVGPGRRGRGMLGGSILASGMCASINLWSLSVAISAEATCFSPCVSVLLACTMKVRRPIKGCCTDGSRGPI